MIGEFEYLILAATSRLADNAYGAAIRGEIESATGHPCSIGALYTTLDRLESKKYVRSWMGEATPQRGGRAKRMVEVTAEGGRAAEEFFNAIRKITKHAAWAASRREVLV